MKIEGKIGISTKYILMFKCINLSAQFVKRQAWIGKGHRRGTKRRGANEKRPIQ